MDYTNKTQGKSMMKRVGWFFASFSPLIYFFMIQLFAVVAMVWSKVIEQLPAMVMITTEEEYLALFDTLMDSSMNGVMSAEVFSQSLGIVCFGLWYYYCTGKPKWRSPREVLNAKSVGYIIGLCVSVDILISLVMGLVENILPDVMAEYEELMDLAGLNDLSVFVMLTAVILAPIVEELAFRGCTIGMAEKAGLPFWVINIFQAALFGAAHMNWVQSSYAFVLGLLLGYVYHRYHSLWAAILLHFIFNFLGTVVTSLVSGLTLLDLPAITIILYIAGTIGVIAFIRLIAKDTNK